MATLSTVINTLNEEQNISDCLESVKSISDEIIICDMHSDDKTVEIAKKFNAKIYLHDRIGYVEPARNFAFSKATSDWILLVDADERIPEELGRKIRDIIQNPKSDVYYIAEKNLLFGTWIKNAIWWPDYHPRLFRKGSLTWPNEIHTSPKVIGPSTYLEAKEDYAILHYAYDTVSEFVNMINNYTTFEAEELKRQGYKFRRRHVILQPLREFHKRFIKTKGYKDGFDGLVLSILLGFYKFVAIIKYWEKYAPKSYKDKNLSVFSLLFNIIFDRKK